MRGKVPVFATLLVGAAVATMIGLGVWQLQRAEWKQALITRYSKALSIASEVAWPRDRQAFDDALYRRSSLVCGHVTKMSAHAGRSANGQAGWMHIAHCQTQGGGEAAVALGWSRTPKVRPWDGGRVSGYIAPTGEGIRLVASPPEAGLVQLRRPDPNDMPNNHMIYVWQWFFFAVTAAVIYVLALRKRWREE